MLRFYDSQTGVSTPFFWCVSPEQKRILKHFLDAKKEKNGKVSLSPKDLRVLNKSYSGDIGRSGKKRFREYLESRSFEPKAVEEYAEKRRNKEREYRKHLAKEQPEHPQPDWFEKSEPHRQVPSGRYWYKKTPADVKSISNSGIGEDIYKEAEARMLKRESAKSIGVNKNAKEAASYYNGALASYLRYGREFQEYFSRNVLNAPLSTPKQFYEASEAVLRYASYFNSMKKDCEAAIKILKGA